MVRQRSHNWEVERLDPHQLVRPNYDLGIDVLRSCNDYVDGNLVNSSYIGGIAGKFVNRPRPSKVPHKESLYYINLLQ